ncbi:hypothetical protein HIM_04639 [Hirsutella minnesotensis 3608]|uniref:Uncharacterized protein n=1 Tax=Hirsutella minnesotensis 3608 TaxID=1043627 RepID=A0A0F7ZPN6_9HYPO|nr:hypothetical protein HIM_04639 [Hirsutella minnesotensis 3608]
MDEIHISWQGPEKPTPRDLSALLSVRRRIVERALFWLKRHNPHYSDVRIDEAEMDGWGAPVDGVPAAVYDRMERYEPSAWEKTRTAHVVPATERGMDDEGAVAIEDILTSLGGGLGSEEGDSEGAGAVDVEPDGGGGADPVGEEINEVTSSGMFALDSVPDVADAEKLRFACQAVGGVAGVGGAGPTATVQTSRERSPGPGEGREAFIRVSRGDDFADSSEAAFFAKTFPTLFPFGVGGPKLAEEATLEAAEARDTAAAAHGGAPEVEAALVASRNLHLRAWADIVLRRHGGRFATHYIFAFLVFNMDVRSRNRRVSMLSVGRKNFRNIERIVRSITTERLAAASLELEDTGKTSDDDVKELLRSLSLYGHRQPMSREGRLTMRRKIQSSIVAQGLRLAAYVTRGPQEAEAFLEGLGNAYKRTRLAISDPVSSAIFFHREMALFFENNAQLASVLADVNGEGEAAYKERIIRYVDSVFSEDLDAEAFCAVRAERSAVADISSKLENMEQFSSAFEEEANFYAGATQIHTHSATCLKYSLGRQRQKGGLCRFKAPWKLVEKTSFTDEGILKIRRTHPIRRLREASGTTVADNATDETIVVEEAGHRLGHVEAYNHRGQLLEDLCLYDYASTVRLKRRDGNKEEPAAAWGEVPFEDSWPPGRSWVQVLRRPGKQATVCLDGYLSKDFSKAEEDEPWTGANDGLPSSPRRRAAVQHLALFVPWERFLCEERGDINDIWTRARRALSPRISCLVENVQLLRRSAEDAKRDAKHQVTAGSAELTTMMQQLGRFQHSALGSMAELEAAAVPERGVRRISMPGRVFTGAAVPSQAEVRGIKSQQMSASRERERMIQGRQSGPAAAVTDHRAALRAIMSGFGEDDIEVAATDTPEEAEVHGSTDAEMEVQLGPSTSLLAVGREWARRLTLNKRQSIAFLIIYRHLDVIRGSETANAEQLCQFVGGEGGTGKSRVIEALAGLFAARGISSRLLITATSGTAAARIDSITIHSACGLTKD